MNRSEALTRGEELVNLPPLEKQDQQSHVGVQLHTHAEIREQTARKSLFRKLERQDDDSISCFQTKRCDPIQRGILIKSEREKGRTIKRRPFQHQDSFKGKVCNQYFNQNKKQSFCGVRIRVPVVRRVEDSTVNFGWFLYRQRLTNLA